MRHASLVFLAGLALTGNAIGEPIHFEQIPTEASGYVHIDIDRVQTSRLLAHFVDPANPAASPAAWIETHVSSLTIYSRAGGGSTTRLVVLLHARGNILFDTLESDSIAARDSVVFTYANQKVYYSSAGQFASGWSTQPSTNLAGKTEAVSNPSPKKRSASIWLGMDGSTDINEWTNGPSYRAFIAPDLIVATTDLKSMADELDVLSGKSPSLAVNDPRNLKATFPAGAMMVGAGLTAGFGSDDLETVSRVSPTSRPTMVDPSRTGGFGLDLFGSFRGRAMLGRFDAGEDDQNEFIHLTIGMRDAASAQQLKNLITGVTALIVMSQVPQKDLIASSTVSAEGSNVLLQWTWPASRLEELTGLIKQQNNDADMSPSTRAVQPARGAAHE